MERIILHVDVNNAFLSWTAVEMLNNDAKKDIREEVSIIGGNEAERRGVVLAKSTPAKSFGIKTGESIYSAKTKYKNIKIYPPDHKLYKEYSDKLYNYLSKYSPLIERYSIDECFIDYTGCEKLFGDPIKLAYKIKEEVKEKFLFTVNVGIGNNKLCAKMASDFTKPDKVHTLFMSEIKDKLWSLDVSELFMIGRKTTERLKSMNINTIGDLANYDLNKLIKVFKNQAYSMIESANGIDNSSVETESEPKSISSSTVLPYDYKILEDIKKVMKELSLDVGTRLRKNKFYATTISVSIKYSDFSHYSKQNKFSKGINSDIELYNESIKLFEQLWNRTPIRHIAVAVRDFSNINNIQLSFEESEEDIKENKILQDTIDNIRNKYGTKSMLYGDMLNKNK